MDGGAHDEARPQPADEAEQRGAPRAAVGVAGDWAVADENVGAAVGHRGWLLHGRCRRRGGGGGSGAMSSHAAAIGRGAWQGAARVAAAAHLLRMGHVRAITASNPPSL